MKTIFLSGKFKTYLFVVLFALTIQTTFSQSTKPFSINESPLPAPTAPVNDFAGVLDEATKAQLNQRLIEFRDRTNPRVEIAVAVVKTTGERPIFDYSLAVAHGWKIGSKVDDNPSLLLFVAVDDRKAYTQVSKDLEDELPDALTVQLARQNLVPAFRQGDYNKGVTDTIEAYIRTIEERGNGAQVAENANQSDNTTKNSGRRSAGSGCNFMTCLIILFILMIIIFSRFGSGRGGGRGGGISRGGGSGFGSALPWIILGSGLGRGGGSSDWGGSSSDWGGNSGGGDSWGGFGGSGDFGGGGGGVDW